MTSWQVLLVRNAFAWRNATPATAQRTYQCPLGLAFAVGWPRAFLPHQNWEGGLSLYNCCFSKDTVPHRITVNLDRRPVWYCLENITNNIRMTVTKLFSILNRLRISFWNQTYYSQTYQVCHVLSNMSSCYIQPPCNNMLNIINTPAHN